jgi:hypothetical protein
VSTARADANGVFKFGYVTRSEMFTRVNPAWSYMLVATKGAGESGAKVITVVAGSDTPAGILIVPTSQVSGDLVLQR